MSIALASRTTWTARRTPSTRPFQPADPTPSWSSTFKEATMSVLSRRQARPVRVNRGLSFNPFSASTVARPKRASQGRQVLAIARPQPRLQWPRGRGRWQQAPSGRLERFASLGKVGSSQVRRSSKHAGRIAAAYALVPVGVGAAALGGETKRSRKKPAVLGLLAAAGLVAVARRDQVRAAIARRRSAGSAAAPADAPAPAPASGASAETTTNSAPASS